jgi:hypothetical protein
MHDSNLEKSTVPVGFERKKEEERPGRFHCSSDSYVSVTLHRPRSIGRVKRRAQVRVGPTPRG